MPVGQHASAKRAHRGRTAPSRIPDATVHRRQARAVSADPVEAMTATIGTDDGTEADEPPHVNGFASSGRLREPVRARAVEPVFGVDGNDHHPQPSRLSTLTARTRTSQKNADGERIDESSFSCTESSSSNDSSTRSSESGSDMESLYDSELSEGSSTGSWSDSGGWTTELYGSDSTFTHTTTTTSATSCTGSSLSGAVRPHGRRSAGTSDLQTNNEEEEEYSSSTRHTNSWGQVGVTRRFPSRSGTHHHRRPGRRPGGAPIVKPHNHTRRRARAALVTIQKGPQLFGGLPYELFLVVCAYLTVADYLTLLGVGRDHFQAITCADVLVWRDACLRAWRHKQGFQRFVADFYRLEAAAKQEELAVMALQQRMIRLEFVREDVNSDLHSNVKALSLSAHQVTGASELSLSVYDTKQPVAREEQGCDERDADAHARADTMTRIAEGARHRPSGLNRSDGCGESVKGEVDSKGEREHVDIRVTSPSCTRVAPVTPFGTRRVRLQELPDASRCAEHGSLSGSHGSSLCGRVQDDDANDRAMSGDKTSHTSIDGVEAIHAGRSRKHLPRFLRHVSSLTGEGQETVKAKQAATQEPLNAAITKCSCGIDPCTHVPLWAVVSSRTGKVAGVHEGVGLGHGGDSDHDEGYREDDEATDKAEYGEDRSDNADDEQSSAHARAAHRHRRHRGRTQHDDRPPTRPSSQKKRKHSGKKSANNSNNKAVTSSSQHAHHRHRRREHRRRQSRSLERSDRTQSDAIITDDDNDDDVEQLLRVLLDPAHHALHPHHQHVSRNKRGRRQHRRRRKRTKPRKHTNKRKHPHQRAKVSRSHRHGRRKERAGPSRVEARTASDDTGMDNNQTQNAPKHRRRKKKSRRQNPHVQNRKMSKSARRRRRHRQARLARDGGAGHDVGLDEDGNTSGTENTEKRVRVAARRHHHSARHERAEGGDSDDADQEGSDVRGSRRGVPTLADSTSSTTTSSMSTGRVGAHTGRTVLYDCHGDTCEAMSMAALSPTATYQAIKSSIPMMGAQQMAPLPMSSFAAGAQGGHSHQASDLGRAASTNGARAAAGRATAVAPTTTAASASASSSPTLTFHGAVGTQNRGVGLSVPSNPGSHPLHDQHGSEQVLGYPRAAPVEAVLAESTVGSSRPSPSTGGAHGVTAYLASPSPTLPASHIPRQSSTPAATTSAGSTALYWWQMNPDERHRQLRRLQRQREEQEMQQQQQYRRGKVGRAWRGRGRGRGSHPGDADAPVSRINGAATARQCPCGMTAPFGEGHEGEGGRGGGGGPRTNQDQESRFSHQRSDSLSSRSSSVLQRRQQRLQSHPALPVVPAASTSSTVAGAAACARGRWAASGGHLSSTSGNGGGVSSPTALTQRPRARTHAEEEELAQWDAFDEEVFRHRERINAVEERRHTTLSPQGPPQPQQHPPGTSQRHPALTVTKVAVDAGDEMVDDTDQSRQRVVGEADLRDAVRDQYDDEDDDDDAAPRDYDDENRSSSVSTGRHNTTASESGESHDNEPHHARHVSRSPTAYCAVDKVKVGDEVEGEMGLLSVSDPAARPAVSTTHAQPIRRVQFCQDVETGVSPIAPLTSATIERLQRALAQDDGVLTSVSTTHTEQEGRDVNGSQKASDADGVGQILCERMSDRARPSHDRCKSASSQSSSNGAATTTTADVSLRAVAVSCSTASRPALARSARHGQHRQHPRHHNTRRPAHTHQKRQERLRMNMSVSSSGHSVRHSRKFGEGRSPRHALTHARLSCAVGSPQAPRQPPTQPSSPSPPHKQQHNGRKRLTRRPTSMPNPYRELEEAMRITRAKSQLIHALQRSSVTVTTGTRQTPSAVAAAQIPDVYVVATTAGSRVPDAPSLSIPRLVAASPAPPPPQVPMRTPLRLSRDSPSFSRASRTSPASPAMYTAGSAALAGAVTTSDTIPADDPATTTTATPIHQGQPSHNQNRREGTTANTENHPAVHNVGSGQLGIDTHSTAVTCGDDAEDPLEPVSWKFAYHMSLREAHRVLITAQDLVEGTWYACFRATGLVHPVVFSMNKTLQVLAPLDSCSTAARAAAGLTHVTTDTAATTTVSTTRAEADARLRTSPYARDAHVSPSVLTSPPSSRVPQTTVLTPAHGGERAPAGAAPQARSMPALTYHLLQGGAQLVVHSFPVLQIRRRTGASAAGSISLPASRPSTAAASSTNSSSDAAAAAAFMAEPQRTLLRIHEREASRLTTLSDAAEGAGNDSPTSSTSSPPPTSSSEPAAATGEVGDGYNPDEDWGWTMRNTFVVIFSVDVQAPFYVRHLRRLVGSGDARVVV